MFWVFCILKILKSKLKIRNEFTKLALFSPKFSAEIMWVLGILREKNIKIRIKKTYRIYSKSALFSPKFCAKII
jgi:hypothetical protein